VLIATIGIALLAAWHFGFRAGLIAGGAAFLLLVAAIAMPAHAIKIYGVVAVGVVGICLVGPRVARDEARPVKRSIKTVYKVGKGLVNQLRKRAN
jgi:NhaP-type Na+/H+ or K+/H+ antiporter